MFGTESHDTAAAQPPLTRRGQRPTLPVVPGIAAEVSELAARIDSFAEGADSAAGAVERANYLLGLRQVVDAAEAAFTQVLARFDAHGDGQTLSGAATTASWCRRQLRMSGGDAASRLRLARLAQRVPEMGQALERCAEGDLRFEQVRQISHSVRVLDTLDDAQGDAVALLSTLADHADPAAIAAAGRRLRDVVCPDGSLTQRERQHARRFLTLSPLLDGMTVVDGLLDPEATATLSSALAPLMVPAGPDDTRSSSQRRADALTDLAALALRSEQLPTLSGHPASVDVVVALPALTGASGRHAVTGETGSPQTMLSERVRDQLESLLADPLQAVLHPQCAVATGVVLDHPGQPASLQHPDVTRILCDASIGRIVLGPDSVPLDLGRRSRLFSADQRRALTLRDGGCRFPGCERPPRFTDAHHLVAWTRGGPTDLVNGLLLCRWHHRLVHEPPDRGGWQVNALAARRGANGPLQFVNRHGAELVSDPRAP